MSLADRETCNCPRLAGVNHQVAGKMRFTLAFIAVFTILGQGTVGHGDSWGPITKFEFRSENGRHLLRIEPHDNWPDKPGHCRATLYRDDGDKRTELWSRFLINNHAPVKVFVSNSGRYVLTMDEWHSVGELPVVIYGRRGYLIRVHNTDSLGLKDDIEHITRSVSSYWWNENSTSFFGPDGETFFVRLHWGKLVMLDLSSGDLMDDDWYDIARGWRMPKTKWKSLHDYARREVAKRTNAKQKISD